MLELYNATLVDAALSTNVKSGYRYVVAKTDMTPGVSDAVFKATANPLVTSGLSRTGARKFGVREDGAMHAQTDNLATPLTDAELLLTTNILG
jgi:hypothetical protein